MMNACIIKHKKGNPDSNLRPVRSNSELNKHAKSYDGRRNNNEIPFKYGSASKFTQRSRPIQTKLEINTPGDKYEREADQIADHIVSVSSIHSKRNHGESNIQNKPFTAQISNNNSLNAQRKCAQCEEEEEAFVQRKASGNGSPLIGQGMISGLNNSKGGGRPMDSKTNNYMSWRFGVDFSNVRIHNNDKASELSQGINAKAFTTGNDIYFNKGAYNPQTSNGKWLLAHELTHTIQQQEQNQVSTIQNSPIGTPLIQAYSLKGFPKNKTGKETVSKKDRMKIAINEAVTKVTNCKKLHKIERFFLAKSIKNLRYDYVPNLKYCGWTFPFSWYVEIGEKAFDHKKCCDLSSTIAHEASHTDLKTEGGADKLECDCFNCSC